MQSPCIASLRLTLWEQSNFWGRSSRLLKKAPADFGFGKKKDMKVPEDGVGFLNLLPVISPL